MRITPENIEQTIRDEKILVVTTRNRTILKKIKLLEKEGKLFIEFHPKDIGIIVTWKGE